MKQNQKSLFSQSINRPLAWNSRPTKIEDYVGHSKTLSKINNLDIKNIPHIVLSGPAGCGKTTLAQLIGTISKTTIHTFSAVLSGVSELRVLIASVIAELETTGEKSIIFIDEIHRFNKAQQDALLPHLEKGDFILLGATTESPNIMLNKALLSRVQTWYLQPLSVDDIQTIIVRINLDVPDEIIKYIAANSNGDARFAINALEQVNLMKVQNVSEAASVIFENNRTYDKNGNRHYDVISAFIKSIRGSDVDAAILWLAVMLDGGEDIEFIGRRLIISASEDVGNADPRGLQMATAALTAVKSIGMPEARIILAQVTTYLARAPKSNSSYKAIDEALDYVRSNPTIKVPTHLQNQHPDKKNYKYPHSYINNWVEQSYKNTNKTFYQSSGNGYEKMQDDYEQKIKN